MRIKIIISQYRRDFKAIYICEHCSYEQNNIGYDDIYFHQNVIPNMKCTNCGKVSPKNYTPHTTKYKESEVV